MRIFLKLVLFLAGLFIVLTGVNIGFGGIPSLGWTGSNAFVTVVDRAAFAVQDSHVRFVGGVWLGVGLTFLGGAVAPAAWRQPLLWACGLIFLGGIVRLASLDFAVLLGPKLIGSLGAELIGVPVLAGWIWAQTR